MKHQSFLTHLARSKGLRDGGSRPVRYSSSLEALAWAGARDLIAELAIEHQLRILSLTESKSGMIHALVSFEVSGPEGSVIRFMSHLGACIDAYETRRDQPKPARPGLFSRAFQSLKKAFA